MAEQPVADRTEPATPKRRAEARGRGQVLRSQEVNIAVSLLVALTVLGFSAPHIMAQLSILGRSAFGHPTDYELTAGNLPGYFRSILVLVARIVMPVAGAGFLAAVLANLLQVGFLVSTHPLIPKLESLNPITGLKRYFSMRGLAESAKAVLKVLIVMGVAYLTLKGSVTHLVEAGQEPLAFTLALTRGLFFKLTLRILAVFIVLAFLDYIYQRYEYEKGLKMTRQEVKQELKETEGDPQIKGKIRQLQIAAVRRRMMSAVKTADVVVTNPTHLAVALSYRTGEMEAPEVVAKGARLVAERIKTLAKEHGVPIVEDKPLARALFKSVEVGSPVPPALFRAVAEVLAYVYRLKGRRR